MKKLAIIGGKGFEDPETFLEDYKKITTETPFGDNLSDFYTGRLAGKELVLLFRHGIKHDIPSFKINYQANIYALKQLGVTHIIATSLCGSLQEEVCPEEIVVIDQFIDQTKYMGLSFLDKIPEAELSHEPMIHPFSPELRDIIIESAVKKGITVHTKGTVVSVEGPRYTTRAESNMYRHWKADIVNMTSAPEAILTNEIGIQYSVVSLCTNYESWRTDIRPATTKEKNEVIASRRSTMTTLIKESVARF